MGDIPWDDRWYKKVKGQKILVPADTLLLDK